MGSNPTPSAMMPSGAIPPGAHPSSLNVDEAMGLALDEARAALAHDDVPIGAVVVRDGEVIAARHNERELHGDPDGARRDPRPPRRRGARRALAAGRLHAVRHARAVRDVRRRARQCPARRLVYGAADPKAGGGRQPVRDLRRQPGLNHRPPVTAGVPRPTSADSCSRTSSPVAAGPARPLAFRRPRKGARVDEWDGLENR